MSDRRFRIGGTYISITSPVDANAKIVQMIKNGVNGYICVSNPRTVTFATRHKDYREVMELSLMNIPDAEPMLWAAKLWGLKEVKRTMGPMLFNDMLMDKGSGIKHFLLGDTDETLSRLKEKYNDSNIVGVFSPPFCNLDQYDYQQMADIINRSGANIVWTSLRAPKQDFFAQRLSPLLEKKICIGVGAAFRFSLGQYKMVHPIIKKLGLMGLFWGKKNQSWPRFIWSYLDANIPYLWYLAKIPLWRLLGREYFE